MSDTPAMPEPLTTDPAPVVAAPAPSLPPWATENPAQTPQPYMPNFAPRVRTIVYVSGVIIAFLSFVAAGAASVLMADPKAVVTIAALIGTGWSTVSLSFGVAYRPTK